MLSCLSYRSLLPTSTLCSLVFPTALSLYLPTSTSSSLVFPIAPSSLLLLHRHCLSYHSISLPTSLLPSLSLTPYFYLVAVVFCTALHALLLYCSTALLLYCSDMESQPLSLSLFPLPHSLSLSASLSPISTSLSLPLLPLPYLLSLSASPLPSLPPPCVPPSLPSLCLHHASHLSLSASESYQVALTAHQLLSMIDDE